MNEISTIAARLKALIAHQQLSESALARRSGVPHSTINRILKGESRSPRLTNLEKLARALGTTASYLTHGEAHTTWMPSEVGTTLPSSISYPVLDLARRSHATAHRATRNRIPHAKAYPIVTWQEAIRPERIGGLDEALLPMLSSDHSPLGVAFWLCMEGDDMAAPQGMTPTLPKGTLVLFDSGIAPEPGGLVLAYRPRGHWLLLCRQLVKEQEHAWLRPLNPASTEIMLERSIRLLAVAVESRTFL
ncbi:MAG: helix-turn-helix domain-containing protein [Pseudomonadota bacterium]